jgi:hypothetical protein
MTTIEAHNLVRTICDTAVQRGFFANTGDVVQVHDALELLKPAAPFQAPENSQTQ